MGIKKILTNDSQPSAAPADTDVWPAPTIVAPPTKLKHRKGRLAAIEEAPARLSIPLSPDICLLTPTDTDLNKKIELYIDFLTRLALDQKEISALDNLSLITKHQRFLPSLKERLKLITEKKSNLEHLFVKAIDILCLTQQITEYLGFLNAHAEMLLVNIRSEFTKVISEQQNYEFSADLHLTSDATDDDLQSAIFTCSKVMASYHEYLQLLQQNRKALLTLHFQVNQIQQSFLHRCGLLLDELNPHFIVDHAPTNLLDQIQINYQKIQQNKINIQTIQSPIPTLANDGSEEVHIDIVRKNFNKIFSDFTIFLALVLTKKHPKLLTAEQTFNKELADITSALELFDKKIQAANQGIEKYTLCQRELKAALERKQHQARLKLEAEREAERAKKERELDYLRNTIRFKDDSDDEYEAPPPLRPLPRRTEEKQPTQPPVIIFNPIELGHDAAPVKQSVIAKLKSKLQTILARIKAFFQRQWQRLTTKKSAYSSSEIDSYYGRIASSLGGTTAPAEPLILIADHAVAAKKKTGFKFFSAVKQDEIEEEENKSCCWNLRKL